jgi:hypothetical protein
MEQTMAHNQLAAADLAVESLCEVSFAFEAFQAKFGHIAQAARQLSSGPIGAADASIRLLAFGSPCICQHLSWTLVLSGQGQGRQVQSPGQVLMLASAYQADEAAAQEPAPLDRGSGNRKGLAVEFAKFQVLWYK